MAAAENPMQTANIGSKNLYVDVSGAYDHDNGVPYFDISHGWAMDVIVLSK